MFTYSRKSFVFKALVHLFLLVSSTVSAQFMKVVEGFEKNTNSMVTAEVEREKSRNNISAVESRSSFFINSELGYEQGRDASIFAFASQESTTETGSLTFGKNFAWGGTLAYTHSLVDQDISKWDQQYITAFGGDHAYFSTNSLSYTQDLGKNFFGKSYRLQVDQAELSHEMGKSNYQKIEEETLLKAFSLYQRAKLNKTLKRISEDFLQRSEKRKKLLQKRFKDGVAIRADYLKSQNAYLRAEEILRDSMANYENSLRELKDTVGKEVVENSILKFTSTSSISLAQEGEVLKKNKTYDLIKKKEALAQARLKEFEVQDNYDLDLSLSFSRTALKNRYSESFSDSFSQDDFETKAAALSLTIPFGESSDDVNKVNQLLELKKVKTEKVSAERNLKRYDQVLRNNLKKMQKNLASSKSRLTFNQRILKEQNRRYNRGQIDFDRVLTAEEDLLEAERSYYQYFSQLVTMKADINYLNGFLKESLANYRE